MPYLDQTGLSYLIQKIKTLFDKKADLASPSFTGAPKAPTPVSSNNSTQIATTAFVKAQNYAAGSHTHSAVTTGAAGFMSAADKTKLDGIATNANNYTHPSTHPGTMITTSDGRNVEEIFANAKSVTDWNDAIRPGWFYSSSSAANKPPSPVSDDWFGEVFVYFGDVKQILTPKTVSADVRIERWVRTRNTSGTWSSWTQSFAEATTSKYGLMSSADKVKLNGAAPIASPAFTGTPTAPTAATSANSTQIATTAFVKAQNYATGNHTHSAATTGAAGFMSAADKTKLDSATTFVYNNPILSTLGSDILMKITAASNPNNAKSVKILVTGTVTLGTLSANKAYMDFGSSLDIPVHIDWSNAVFPQMNTKTENITLIRHTGVNTVYHEGLTIRAATNDSLSNGTTCIQNAGSGDVIIHNCDLTGVDTIGALSGGVAVRHTGTGRTFIDNCQLQHVRYGSNIYVENDSGEVFISNSRLRRLENYGTMLNTRTCRTLHVSNCALEGNVSISGKNVFLSNCDVKGSFTVSSGACAAIENSFLYCQGNSTGTQAALYLSGEVKLTNCTLIGENENSSSAASISGYGAYLNSAAAKLTAVNCTFRGYKHSSNTAGYGLGIGASSSISANACMVLYGCRFDRVAISSRTQTADITVGTSSVCPKYNIVGCSFYSSTVSLGGSNISSTTTTNKYMPSYSNFFSQTS